MKDIKTRDHTRGIRTLDKAAIANEHMKSLTIRSREAAESSTDNDGESSNGNYAANAATENLQDAAHASMHTVTVAGRKARQGLRQHSGKADKAESPDDSKKSFTNRRNKEKLLRGNGTQQKTNAIHTTEGIAAEAAAGKKTSRRVRIVRTRGASKGAPAKHAAVSKAKKDAVRAKQAAQAAARQTSFKVKKASEASRKIMRAILAKSKALVAAIAAGGSVTAFTVILICMIGLILASCFGILFAGEDTGGSMTLRDAIAEVNADYEAQINNIQSGTAHDVVEIAGSRTVWKDVLAVYAVKTTTDPNASQEVVTMTEEKKQILSDLFWSMNSISSRTATETRTVVTESADQNGEIVATSEQVEQTVLYITITHKTESEMTNEELNAALYEKVFAEQQRYREWLLSLPPDEILNHTYKFTVREDIVLALEYHNLSDKQCRALLKSPSPLADVFKEFEKRETDHMDIIRDAIECRANAVIRQDFIRRQRDAR